MAKPQRAGRKRVGSSSSCVETNLPVSLEQTRARLQHLFQGFCVHSWRAVRPIVMLGRHDEGYETARVSLHRSLDNFEKVRCRRLPHRKEAEYLRRMLVIHHADEVRHPDVDAHEGANSARFYPLTRSAVWNCRNMYVGVDERTVVIEIAQTSVNLGAIDRSKGGPHSLPPGVFLGDARHLCREHSAASVDAVSVPRLRKDEA